MAASNTFGEYGGTSTEKPCRTCMDFKSWAKLQKKVLNKEAIPDPDPDSSKTSDDHKREHLECPLDKDELGRNTWSFLHTMAAYYPDTPNTEQQTDVKQFFSSFSRLYPCSFCAKDLQEVLKVSPPPTNSQDRLSQWLCDVHNGVNKRLGKPLFDCSRVNERWRDGWKDGSCDG